MTTAVSRRLYTARGPDAHAAFYWIAIVQNADSHSLFNGPDAGPLRGWSEQSTFSLRQLKDLFSSEADRLIERQIELVDRISYSIDRQNRNQRSRGERE